MTSIQFVFLAIAAGLVMTTAWNIIQSRRVDRLYKRMEASEKKAA